MKMKKFNSILDLNNAIVKNNGQLNLDILLNRRANFGEGWEDFTMEEDEIRNQINTIVDDVLGGWEKHKYSLKYQLNNVPLSHWGFSRIIYTGKRWIYAPGQDGQTELKQIRNYIRK